MRSRAWPVDVALAALFAFPSLLLAQVTVSPADPVVTAPTTCQPFTALIATIGRPAPVVFLWSVSDPAQFSVDSAGVVCFRGAAPAAGGSQTTVTATSAGQVIRRGAVPISGSTTYTVLPAPPPQPTATIRIPRDPIARLQGPSGPPPTGVTAASGSPVRATISWAAAAGATGYTVARGTGVGGPFNPVTATPITGTSFVDQTLTPSTTYYWVVTANYSAGFPGSSSAVSASTLAPTNPTNFTARAGAVGEIILSWSPRTDAGFYWLQGDGVPAQQVNGTTFTASNLGPGARNFSLIAEYPSGSQMFADEANPSRTRGAALPPHATWLGKPNLTGSAAEAASYFATIGATPNKDTFAKWKAANGFPAQGAAPDEVGTRYFNAQDLNLGRDTHCRVTGTGLACYQSNSGPEPGTAAFPNAERALADMVNGVPPFATVAMDKAANGNVNFYAYNAAGALVPEVLLDNEVKKPIPNVCSSCHGGHYTVATHTLSGASFLPFDVFGFKFATAPGFSLNDQQEAFRKLNQLVKGSNPNPSNPSNPIGTFIDGMYGGSVATPGTTANDNWVPAGWAAKPNVYDVFKRTCRTCHLAVSESFGQTWDFITYKQLADNLVRVQTDMCVGSRTMPHAEVPYRKFWTQTTVYLPGYWSDPSVLGITGCP